MKKFKVLRRGFNWFFILIAATLVVSGFFIFTNKVQAATLEVCLEEGCDYASIQSAITAATSGDTINVAAGTYEEIITIEKPLTLRGATYDINKNGYDVPEDYAWDDTVESIIQPPSGSPDADVITIDDADDVIVEGFVIQALDRGASGTRMLITVHVDNKTMENLVIKNNVIGANTNAEDQDGTKGRMNLYFDINPYDESQGLINSLVSGNKIFGSEGNGNNIFIWASYYAYGATGPSPMTGTIIEDNEIYGSHRSGIETAGGFSGLVIRNNTIYGNSGLETDDPTNLKYGHGILIDRGSSDRTINGLSAEDLTIKNNEIYNNEKSAIYLGPINKNYTIEDNIISGNGWDGIMIDFDGNFCNPDFEACPLPDEVKSCYDCTENININKNRFIDNGNHGIHVVSSETTDIIINAKNNYWGAATGPNTAGADSVEGGVEFAPFYTDVVMSAESTEYSVCASGCNFTTIQEAIDVAESGNTINVGAGTYVQDGDLTIDKTLTILGMGEKPTIQFDGKCDSVVIEADNVTLENLRFYKTNQDEGWSSPPTCAANTILEIPKAGPPEYLSLYEGLTIDSCTFEGGRYAMYINSRGDFTLTNSEFVDSAGDYSLIHIAAFEGTLTISGNNFTDMADNRVMVIEPGPDEQILYGGTINITENTISDIKSFFVYNHWADTSKKVDINIEDNNLSDVTEEAVLFFTCGDVDIGKIDSVEVLGNTISNTKHGIRIDTTSCPGWGIPTNVIGTFSFNAHSNSFSDIDEYGVLNETSNLIKAEQNYWDDASGPSGEGLGTGSVISENVSYSPWYTDIELTSLKAPTTTDPATGDTVLELDEPIDIINDDIIVSMPAEITITATASWEGIINTPSVEVVALDTPSPESGYNTTIDTIIEVGYPNIKLVFNKAVKILIPNQAGKRVGYTRTGEPFTEIIDVCSSDIQPTDDSFLPPEGSCKTDVGNDLAVWTKHFTQFIVYSYSPIIIGPTFRAVRPPEEEPEEMPSVLSEEAQKLDTNEDEKIDDLDLKELFANWGSTILENIADFNDDSKVDVFDFNLLMVHWTE